MRDTNPDTVPCSDALCRSCGRVGVVACVLGERFNTFACTGCGEVVPCAGGFARAADINRLADPKDAYAVLREVAGCLSCGSDVLHPRGGRAGDCVNCGRVQLVAGSAQRFRRAPGLPSLQLRGLPAREIQDDR